MNQVIAGIDLSLRRSGFTIIDKDGKILHQEFLKTDKMRGMQRLLFIKTRIIQKLNEFKVSKVIIEGYSFGSKGAAVVSLGELGGVVRLAMFESKFTYLDCSPSSLKAYTTGKGNSDKEMMRIAVRVKYGIDYEDDNVCDSYALCMMAYELGDEMERMCQKGGAALIKKKKEIEIRKFENSPGFFVKLLLIGIAKATDLKKELISKEKNYKDMKLSEYLGISEKESSNLLKSPSKYVKVLNKQYSSL